MASQNLSRASQSNLTFGRARRGTMYGVPFTPVMKVSLGAPLTADADGISVSQTITFATTPEATITGALADGGAVEFDVPRNVVAAWTGTAVTTVTGTDEYGHDMVEVSASGTSLTGKKAFKTVTSVAVSANVTSFTAGSGTKLGLPYRLRGTEDVLAKFVDGVADAGTVVAAVTTSDSTSADVRGTFAPASAPDGSKAYVVWMAAYDNDTVAHAYGVDQYAG